MSKNQLKNQLTNHLKNQLRNQLKIIFEISLTIILKISLKISLKIRFRTAQGTSIHLSCSCLSRSNTIQLPRQLWNIRLPSGFWNNIIILFDINCFCMITSQFISVQFMHHVYCVTNCRLAVGESLSRKWPM